MPDRQGSSRQSPQISGSPHTTPTSPMNQSREMSQLSMFRVGSETELEHGSSCEGDLGPCTSDGMPASAPSSAFNIGPSAQQKHPAPALLRREADSPSPQPMPPRARDTAAEMNVGLSKVVLDGESGEQKALLDSSASLWSPLLTTGVAGLQTTGTSSMQAEAAAAAARLPAAPSLQSWAGSLEVPGRAAGLSSTYSSPVAAVGGPQEIAPSSPAGPLQELLGAGRDADVSMQGGSVSLSMLAQVKLFTPNIPVGSEGRAFRRVFCP